ncbi:peptidase U32 family protein [Paenibacillus sp. MBLB4367]|uniref:peptidase U32 family protein n=1 Tax=Paenibacillus sp. MBLB4367 TaxID=3384767 RepID=UPI0039080756
MNKKPELLTTAGSIKELERLIEAGADAFVIGEQRYGMRLAGDFAPEQVAEAVKLAHGAGAKIYVAANNIMDNAVLPELPGYLSQMETCGADAIVFGDPALLLAARDAKVKFPFHWNPEMTATNYATANYWAAKGATRVVLARELNMEQVLEFKRNAKIEVQVQVHGITNIFHSKRKMVQNYFDHLGRPVKDAEIGKERGLFLLEAERQDEKYPIYEDRNGTHIMSSDDVCMLESLHELMEAGIDSLKIEGLMKDVAYNEAVVSAYRKAIDAYFADPEGYAFQEEWLQEIERIQPGERPLSFGFFYKEQVY